MRLLPRSLFSRMVIILLSGLVLAQLLSFANSWVDTGLEWRLLTDVRQRVHDHIQSLSLDFFTGSRSGALMQRDQWPGLNATNGGGASMQISPTNGQRAAKRQPDGGVVILGTMPSMVARCDARRSSRGIEPSRPTV